MNKELMLDWVKSCVVSESSTVCTLLLVDSWTPFKDHAAIQSMVPAGKHVKVMNIPPGTTSEIQPLDVHFFLAFKAMYKRFTSYVSSRNWLFCYTRDSIPWLLSLIYHQFTAPRQKFPHVSVVCFWILRYTSRAFSNTHSVLFRTRFGRMLWACRRQKSMFYLLFTPWTAAVLINFLSCHMCS